MLDVRDPYAAWCLDSAVRKFGAAVEHAVAEVKGKGKTLQVNRNQTLRRWLELPAQYRSPAAG